MKKVFTVLMIVVLCLSLTKSNAQFNKKTWMLLGYSALWFNAGKEKVNQDGTKSEGSNVMSIYMKTGGAYFLLPALAAGLAINWQYDMSKYSTDGSTEKNHTSEFYMGPFLRYYFFQYNFILLYAEALIAFGGYSQVYNSSGISKNVESLLKAHLLVGMSVFLTQAIALDFAMGYQWSKYKNKDSNFSTSYNQFMACVGLVFFLGQNGGLVNFQR